MPVLQLRESAQVMGLLRKSRGRLTVTARGARFRTDPVGLWWHLAERMPLKSNDPCEQQAGLLYLIAVAARTGDDPNHDVAELLNALGWTSGNDSPITKMMASRAAWNTKSVLRVMGALERRRDGVGPEQPGTDAITFARAALRTWPD